MKPAKKPFVVEIRNRRRLSRREHSIWEKVDLKTAGNQSAAEQVAEEDDAAEAVSEKNAIDISA